MKKFTPVEPIWVRRNGILVAQANTYGAVHGKRSTYVNRLCRCGPCSAAAAAYDAARDRRDTKRPCDIPHGMKHGVNTYVHYNCRCRKCKDAMADKSRRYRERKRNAPDSG